MKRLLIASMLALASCGVPPPSSPSDIAETSVLDEQVAISIELAYQAARVAIETAVDAGLVKGERAMTIATADASAYAAVQAVRAAYRAGNSTNYIAAGREARLAISGLLTSIRK